MTISVEGFKLLLLEIILKGVFVMAREKFEDFLPALRETGLVVDFAKKDGELRLMYCTLDLGVIPDYMQPKNEHFTPKGKQADFYRVFDVENCGWRCIPKGEDADVRVIRVLEKGEARAILDDPDSIRFMQEEALPF